MDYSKMSDFEINYEVLAVIEPDVEHMQLSADQKSFFHCGHDGNGFYETAIPDYCNSWADAGPIIQKHGITLAFFDDEWTADFDAYFVDGVEWNIGGVADKNPLRAAMIVYLMMHDKGEA